MIESEEILKFTERIQNLRENFIIDKSNLTKIINYKSDFFFLYPKYWIKNFL
jgi:hypothetical protein